MEPLTGIVVYTSPVAATLERSMHTCSVRKITMYIQYRHQESNIVTVLCFVLCMQCCKLGKWFASINADSHTDSLMVHVSDLCPVFLYGVLSNIFMRFLAWPAAAPNHTLFYILIYYTQLLSTKSMLLCTLYVCLWSSPFLLQSS